MCDFHSCVVYTDGRLFHIASNSHSGAVAASSRAENTIAVSGRFVECEWDGSGEYPGADKITRSKEINEKQRKTIDAHYGALSKLIADPKSHAERMLFDGGIFSSDDYADIRWRVLIHPDCPKRAANKLAVTSLYANHETIKSLHPKVKEIVGGFRVAAGFSITAPVLAQSGYVVLYQGATFTAPVLAQSGYVGLYQGATFTAPLLKR